MKQRAVWIVVLVLAAAVLFYFENRPAYRTYFSDDDLVNLGWPTFSGMDVFIKGLLTPLFHESNFRPVGFLYYRIMGLTFHLNFPPYVCAIQAIHLLNALLLFGILRRLDLSLIASATGVLFFVFDVTVMETYWRPMYVFDLLCGTLCLLTLLLYLRGHWLLALVTFWLAYKSKELAVMLPVGLAAYEWLFGERRWKRLIPYFAISLNFGLQALFANSQIASNSVYALNLSPALVWKTATFYSSAIFFLPFAGFALSALPLLVRNRRVYFGLLFMAAMLLPLLMLTNRYAQAYWYVPLIGLAIALAGVASRIPVWAIAVFFLVWLPMNFLALRETRRSIFLQANDARWYEAGLQEFARRIPPVKTVIFESVPWHMEPWGVKGAIQLAFGRDVATVWTSDPDAPEAKARFPVAFVTYYQQQHLVKGRLQTRAGLESSIDFRENAPAAQLGEGWSRDFGEPSRQVEARAEATLHRPAGSQAFELTASAKNPVQVTVLEDGRSLGTQALSGAQTLRWKLDGGTSVGTAGDHRLTIASDAEIAVQSFGYAER